MLRLAVVILALVVSGCTSDAVRDRSCEGATVTASARGWSIEPGPGGTTVVECPSGRTHDVGWTQYPDIAIAQVYLIEGPRRGERSLVLYIPPVSSGGATMSVYTVDSDDLVRLYDIRHRYEFGMICNQADRPRVGVVDQPMGIDLRRLIFPSEGDAEVAELRRIFEWPYGEVKGPRVLAGTADG